MIKLRFSRGHGPAGAVVRTFTWSWCSHVGIALPDGRVLDATPEFGVSVRKAVDDDSTIYFRIRDLNESGSRTILSVAHRQIGKPYDWRGCLAIGLHRDWQDPGAWFCSELVAWAFAAAGEPLLRGDHVSRLTPRDLLLSPRLWPVDRLPRRMT